ncbi:kinase-like domain-containing protein [Absidia repens]|uniref:Kinase-like domain-containing protein n=1 Tax=Absidia repens TaxID=90262 RepID=A0A1X2HXK2_9FUNG|nr:kinase-like domain-containing protein [Absidia repens]
MVAQHTTQHNNANNNTTASGTTGTSGNTPRLLTTTARQTQLDDHRLRTHRLSEPFLYGSDASFDPTSSSVAKSAALALQLYGGCISGFERQQEIHDYSNAIYFVGPPTSVKASHYRGHLNHGFDDERGDYMILKGDHLAYRYEVLDELGKGSFGQVVKCFDHKTNTSVAIKLIRNKRRFHEQALMEVKILKDLVEWDPEDGHHNVRMTDYFYFRNHLCIVCECLSINLYEFIKKYEYKGFAVSLIKRFAVQLLRSLCLLYDHDVIHCDLKPENILLKHPAKSTIKVIDFGSSCFTNEKMYTYIQSRFYRAPEIILGTTYNTAIDMWSFGCILAELYTGIPIFPGETEQEQLACIMEVLGLPPMELIERCSRRKIFFDAYHRPRPVINSRGKTRLVGAKTLASVLRCNEHHEPLFLDFIQSCLQWDPDQRLSPYDALQHPWFTTASAKSSAAPIQPVVVVPT